jgi:hypothetical protein
VEDESSLEHFLTFTELLPCSTGPICTDTPFKESHRLSFSAFAPPDNPPRNIPNSQITDQPRGTLNTTSKNDGQKDQTGPNSFLSQEFDQSQSNPRSNTTLQRKRRRIADIEEPAYIPINDIGRYVCNDPDCNGLSFHRKTEWT